MNYKLLLIFEPQPEGGFTVTSPLLPELITEDDTLDDALENVKDALAVVIEVYQETGKVLPPELRTSGLKAEVRTEFGNLLGRFPGCLSQFDSILLRSIRS